LGIEAQMTAVRSYVESQGGTIGYEFTEHESGRSRERPELFRALERCKKKGAILLIAKLDRLARSVSLISRLLEAKVEFVAVDNPSANKLTIHILAALAEHECDMASTRTREALAAAKCRGVKLGNPRVAELSGRAISVLKSKADARAAFVGERIALFEAAGVSTLQQIADLLNLHRVPSARGGAWTAMSVRNVKQRCSRLSQPCGR
jgi:DNA invertase Pin-like site-specific DNA recombinase